MYLIRKRPKLFEIITLKKIFLFQSMSAADVAACHWSQQRTWQSGRRGDGRYPKTEDHEMDTNINRQGMAMAFSSSIGVTITSFLSVEIHNMFFHLCV